MMPPQVWEPEFETSISEFEGHGGDEGMNVEKDKLVTFWHLEPKTEEDEPTSHCPSVYFTDPMLEAKPVMDVLADPSTSRLPVLVNVTSTSSEATMRAIPVLEIDTSADRVFDRYTLPVLEMITFVSFKSNPDAYTVPTLDVDTSNELTVNFPSTYTSPVLRVWSPTSSSDGRVTVALIGSFVLNFPLVPTYRMAFSTTAERRGSTDGSA